ncbi:MAG: hypothetical protein ACR2M6_01735 [Vampirovibrionia bacterium]
MVWELEKAEIEEVLLDIGDPGKMDDLRKCWYELSAEARPYYIKRLREATMELMEKEVEEGKINEGQYLDGANRLARQVHKK